MVVTDNHDMKVLILCAGYAQRMYPLTKDRPKALLPVAGKPVIEYILINFERIPVIDRVYIVTNAKYSVHFQKWKRAYSSNKEILILSDNTTSNDTRLGAIGDMQFAIEEASIDDDLLVAAGDNLFTFDINDFIRFFEKRGISIAVHHVSDRKKLTKYNEVKLDGKYRLVSFKEKPGTPRYTLAAICMYIFPREKLHFVHKYLNEGNNPDEPGRLIQWLYEQEDVFGYEFSGKWYDIGNLEQYRRVNQEFTFCIKKNTEP